MRPSIGGVERDKLVRYVRGRASHAGWSEFRALLELRAAVEEYRAVDPEHADAWRSVAAAVEDECRARYGNPVIA